MQQSWFKVDFDLKYFWSCRMRREILPKCFMYSTALHERQNHGDHTKGLAADHMGWDWRGKEEVIYGWRFFCFWLGGFGFILPKHFFRPPPTKCASEELGDVFF